MPTGLCTGSGRRVSLRGLVLAGLVAGVLVGGGAGVLRAQQQPPSAAQPALTQQASVASYGLNLRYPVGWAFASSGDTAQLVHLAQERMATASPATFDQEG